MIACIIAVADLIQETEQTLYGGILDNRAEKSGIREALIASRHGLDRVNTERRKGARCYKSAAGC